MTTHEEFVNLSRANHAERGWRWPGEATYLTLKEIRPNMAAYLEITAEGVRIDDMTELNDVVDPVTFKPDPAKWPAWCHLSGWIDNNWDLHRLDGESRDIAHTKFSVTQDWPEDMFIQGGESGLVIAPRGGKNYKTAFVEAFPEGTFIRGEGPTVPEAEMDAWLKYQKWLTCSHPDGHGDYQRRNTKNGICWCGHCGAYLGKLLAEIWTEEELAGQKSMLARLFSEDDNECGGALKELANAAQNAEDRTAPEITEDGSHRGPGGL